MEEEDYEDETLEESLVTSWSRKQKKEMLVRVIVRLGHERGCSLECLSGV